MPTDKEKIQSKAVEVLKKHKRGLKHSRLVENLLKDFPNKANTISTYVQMLDKDMKDQVYKPARGLFKHTDYRKEEEKPKPEAEKKKEISEDMFYEKFADYLKSELQECTVSKALGGNKFRDKWGTPDVIGVLSGKERGSIVEHEDMIISAEIKSDTSTNELLTAFGQACAYKAFSHKAYVVVPKTSDTEDISRIESLCLIFGIGLILFDSKKPDEPDFEIMTRPIKTEPDWFYVNLKAPLMKEIGLF
jgi:hypothetical protein